MYRVNKIKMKMLDQLMLQMFKDEGYQAVLYEFGKSHLFHLVEKCLCVENASVFYVIVRFKVALVFKGMNKKFYEDFASTIKERMINYHPNVHGQSAPS